MIFDLCAGGRDRGRFTVHPPSAVIEWHDTNDFYLPLDRVVRPAIDALPISVADLLLFGVFVGLALWWVRFCRRPGRPRWGRIALALLRTAAVFAVAVVWFELAWALNYDRVPIAEKLVLHSGPDDIGAIDSFADRVVRMLNADAVAAHAEQLTPEQVRAALEPTFYRAVRLFGDESIIGVPRVKPTVFNPIFRTTGESGFMDPWTHEVNLYSGMFSYEWPAIYAHEWAHASGFANEAEANYIATIACITSAPRCSCGTRVGSWSGRTCRHASI